MQVLLPGDCDKSCTALQGRRRNGRSLFWRKIKGPSGKSKKKKVMRWVALLLRNLESYCKEYHACTHVLVWQLIIGPLWRSTAISYNIYILVQKLTYDTSPFPLCDRSDRASPRLEGGRFILFLFVGVANPEMDCVDDRQRKHVS